MRSPHPPRLLSTPPRLAAPRREARLSYSATLAHRRPSHRIFSIFAPTLETPASRRVSRRSLPRFAIALTLTALSFSAPTRAATTIYVDDDTCPAIGSGTELAPYCAIQTAIDNAVDTDEILVAPGTYNETINFNGKAITLKSTDGPGQTTIEGTGLNSSVVKCISAEGPDTILEGFQITGGTGTLLGSTSRFGGGMYIEGSSPSVMDCMFMDNHASFAGGGMFNRDAGTQVTRCQFLQNSARSGGGGMANYFSNITIMECVFQQNRGESEEDPFNVGGAIEDASGNPIIANCQFIDNHGNIGGAVTVSSSNATVDRCTFVDNEAASGAGGFACYNSVLRMTHCEFRRNSAIVGGALIVVGQPSNVQIDNCSFIQNEADLGGSIVLSEVMPLWINCTIALNYAADLAGGIYNYRNSQPSFSNCVIYGNTDASGTGASSQVYNDDSEGANMPVLNDSCIQGSWTGLGSNNINADPLFVDPANGDLRLNTGSPCIDAGDNTAVPAGITTDLAGNPRFIDSIITPDTGNGTPPLVDMGAHEAPATVAADIDHDGDVDGNDFAFFAACFNKAGNPPRGGCAPEQSDAFDFDDDQDIDGTDFAKFAQCFNNANNPPRPLGCPQY